MTALRKPDPEPARPSSGMNAAGAPIRILLIDDSLTVRTVFSRMISREADMEVVCGVGTAEAGLKQLDGAAIDVILLDLEMPGMGGLEALPLILSRTPKTKVLVISSLTAEGADHTVTALRMGAADTMLKPRPGGFDDDYRDQLLTKIRVLKAVDPSAGALPTRSPQKSPGAGRTPEIVAIGASTGGIHALNLFLTAIPDSFSLPILITQHLPSSFIPVFAKQMEVAARREAILADDGIEITRNRLIIAPGHGHMTVRKSGSRYFAGLAYHPVKSGCMPSVDPMFESLATACDGKVAAVLLSGMGRDGSDGARSIHDAGGRVYAQNAETCAVWGMPRGVAEDGLACAVAAPQELAAKIAQSVGVNL